ncbi:DctP family TRAP transporter solute-binding subunit [Halobacillus massiliensis]|uniref:DctP family TRAP transporter solute-binding subunit n=1 Tax=Halobacillus massiliensis TaxID=1926286 RepID=UPI0009E25D24|nr:DctP family TRAP transporter solute-binding subunit [Halobacillus massiliensis]
MKTVLTIVSFIVTGIFTALFFGFNINNTTQSLEYDDEQEGIKDEIVINFSHVVAENSPKGMAARRFESLIEERSHGEIKVQIHPNGSLYNDVSEYEALKNGNVEMIAPATTKLTDRYPNWQVLDLPFVFPTYGAVQETYEGEIGQALLSELKRDNIEGLTFWYNGYKQITNNTKPIIHPDDFRHLHFRTMGGPAVKAQFHQLGASTSVLPFNKTYENLEVDFVNGQENTTSNIYSKKLYRHQSYMTLSNHGYLGYAVLINQDFWESLSEEHQKIISAALEETTDWIRRHSIEINDEHNRQLRQQEDFQIDYLTKEQRDLWKQKLLPVYKETETEVDKKIMKQVYKLKNKYENE